jgi:hypothetical protein
MIFATNRVFHGNGKMSQEEKLRHLHGGNKIGDGRQLETKK